MGGSHSHFRPNEVYKNVMINEVLLLEHHADRGGTSTHLAQSEVGGSEVVAPLREAVHLVNAGKGNRGEAEERVESAVQYHCLRRDKQDGQLPCHSLLHHLSTVLVVHVGMETCPLQTRRQALNLQRAHRVCGRSMTSEAPSLQWQTYCMYSITSPSPPSPSVRMNEAMEKF